MNPNFKLTPIVRFSRPDLSPLFDIDSYKASQYAQYPADMTKLYSYFESRLGDGFKKIVMFGLQYIIKTILSVRVTHEEVTEAKAFFMEHMGCFNEEGWRYIVDVHGGYLPLEIKAIPEGTVIERSNCLFSIESLDKNVAWLPQYIETLIVRNWATINVATISYQMKVKLLEAFEKSSDADAKSEVLFKLHDFGSRGAYCQEAASIGGMGHLVNFMGSDTVSAIKTAQSVYNTNDMLAYSIAAMEHSTVTSWGRDGEKAAFENHIRKFAKNYGGSSQFLAMVVDSYDMENAVKNIIGVQLKDLIVNSGSTIVVRPDSGVPAESVVSCLKWLDESFGSTVNSKGYKVLSSCVRVIQGDGINMESLPEIVEAVEDAGFSIENVAFGMGGGLLQKHDRDTFRFAQKCAYIEILGVGRDVQKMPKTDPSKASKKGRLKVVREGDGYVTIADDKKDSRPDELQTVYFYNRLWGHDVPLVREFTMDEVRKNTGLW